MSNFESPALQPPVPAAPYRLPELVLAEKCMGCVSLSACPGPALRNAGLDFNSDLDRLRGTPTEDRVIGAAFAVGLQTIERGFGQAQQAINDCYGGVEIVDTRDSEDTTRSSSLQPTNLAPFLGLYSIPNSSVFQPRETDEELLARGFVPNRSSDGNRVTSVTVQDPEQHLDPTGFAYARRGTSAGLDLIGSLRGAARVQSTFPEDFTNTVLKTVEQTVTDVMDAQLSRSIPYAARRSPR